MGLRTTTVGWFPKPVGLRRARWRFAEGEIDEAKLREVEAEATRNALALQDELGFDLLVEGQMDRSDSVTFFAERLQGMEPAGLVRCFGNRYYVIRAIGTDKLRESTDWPANLEEHLRIRRPVLFPTSTSSG